MPRSLGAGARWMLCWRRQGASSVALPCADRRRQTRSPGAPAGWYCWEGRARTEGNQGRLPGPSPVAAGRRSRTKARRAPPLGAEKNSGDGRPSGDVTYSSGTGTGTGRDGTGRDALPSTPAAGRPSVRGRPGERAAGVCRPATVPADHLCHLCLQTDIPPTSGAGCPLQPFPEGGLCRRAGAGAGADVRASCSSCTAGGSVSPGNWAYENVKPDNMNGT